MCIMSPDAVSSVNHLPPFDITAAGTLYPDKHVHLYIYYLRIISEEDPYYFR